ncbi:hypothetical protein Xcel_3460 (plasmid) [Xylanimonas cellulosilytica DSM 15894]|uniref:Uncharacterized protein n=1 Tax=Xylanimonas cellulosilytica (strain DSM 15894 / JCM 12276 / CECT 5975 / KCTC 9989 / LMG 20990 / NBRC 107835 / XIL07) TaxID=446471 RepID=D1C0Z3_XYLCX|nr:hypothetical protein Xcel_3460 [Xylanimonas cellulosilytica DSM 15894]
MTAGTRPSHCAHCGRPVHPRGTRADDRPADSVLYRGNQLCVECAPARATSGSFGRFQMRPSHLTTRTPSRSQAGHIDNAKDGAPW